jgi:parvulin-like peptidyl-prolyl isomerase
VKAICIWTLTLATLLAGGFVWAQEAAEEVPAVEKLTATDANEAVDANQATKDAVLYTVGPIPVKESQLAGIVDSLPNSIPAHKMDDIREGLTDRLIFAELTKLFLADKEVTVSEDEVTAFKMGMQTLLQPRVSIEMVMAMQGMTEDSITTDISLAKYGKKAITEEKIDAMIKKHPSWFDGTTVEASHILIKSDYTDTTADQLAARKKVEKIRKAITDGKITFAKAAEQYSSCPSSQDGGSLGSFQFHRMDVAFAEVAFALKKDEMSDVVHSGFGFHLIKRTGSIAGSGELEGQAMEQARGIARHILQSRIRQQIGSNSLKTYPIKKK